MPPLTASSIFQTVVYASSPSPRVTPPLSPTPTSVSPLTSRQSHVGIACVAFPLPLSPARRPGLCPSTLSRHITQPHCSLFPLYLPTFPDNHPGPQSQPALLPDTLGVATARRVQQVEGRVQTGNESRPPRPPHSTPVFSSPPTPLLLTHPPSMLPWTLFSQVFFTSSISSLPPPPPPPPAGRGRHLQIAPRVPQEAPLIHGHQAGGKLPRTCPGPCRHAGQNNSFPEAGLGCSSSRNNSLSARKGWTTASLCV